MATTFSAMVAELLTYAHNTGDTTAMSRCLVQALRALRSRNTNWSEGKVEFIIEPGIVDYPFGAYPRLPGGIKAPVGDVQIAASGTAGAIIKPDTLVSSTNLTGTITALQDSAQGPDDDDLRPTTVAATDFVARWDVAQSRPLTPGLSLIDAQGAQVMRLSMFSVGTARTVNWTLKEGVTTRASGSWSVSSTNRTVYEARWDAAVLSTLNPAANQISLTVDESVGEISFSALQWFTKTRDESLALTSGTYRVRPVHIAETELSLGGRKEVVLGFPRDVAFYNNAVQFYPTPSDSLFCSFVYVKDSTRDATTNALITTSSTTETNEWFDTGFTELQATTLALYYALRPHDAKAMQLAQLAAQEAEHANDISYEQTIHHRPPTGIL